MKDIFLYIRELLKAVPAIKWVDLDKGQLNSYEIRPAIDFPAVLIKIDYPSTRKLTRTDQQCEVNITASLVYDFMDDTDSITNDQVLMQSLEVYDTLQAMHSALQGQGWQGIRAPLERSQVRDMIRPDKLKVIQSVYSTRTIA